jgi:hypothetical protein
MENKTDNKTSRASQSRDKNKRPTTWTPPSSLDAPPAPDGFRHRWIRTEVLGFDDTKNMSGKFRSGWELVRADEYPDGNYPTSGRRQILRSNRSWRPCASKDTRGDRKSSTSLFCTAN